MSHLFPDNDRAWHLREIRAPEAWNTSRGAGIRIAHIDTGYTSHVDLDSDALDIASSFDFLKRRADAQDPLWPATFPVGGNTIGADLRKPEWPGHGTFTGSVLISRGGVSDAPDPGAPEGGTTAPGRITGVAPAATLVPFRVERSVITIQTATVGRAILRAIDTDCHVISISLGGLDNQFLFEALHNAINNDLIVVAAGGQYWPLVPFPAQYWACIAAGGTTSGHRPWFWSTHGPAITVSAPAKNVWFAVPDGRTPADGIAKGSGTSFATPCVAGTAALWLAAHGRENLLNKYRGKRPLQFVFREVLEATATNGFAPLAWDPSMGTGIVNAEAVVTAPLPDPDTDPHVVPNKVDAFFGGLFMAPQVPAAKLAFMSLFAAPRHDLTLETIINRYGTELSHIFMQVPPAFELFRTAVEHFAQHELDEAADLIKGVLRLLLNSASQTLSQILRSPE